MDRVGTETALPTAGRIPTLSVILPNYNHARYLPRALDALLAQERPADEIIVVDDASTDDSRSVIAGYAARNPSIRMMANSRNLGAIETLSRGLAAARGDYVYLAAADDFLMPGFFSTALNCLHAFPSVGVFCGEALLIDGLTGAPLGIRPPVRPRLRAGLVPPKKVAALLRHNDNFVVTGAAVFRRSAVNWAGGLDKTLGTFADGYLLRKVALTFGLYFVPQAVLTWCIFPDSISRQTSSDPDRALAALDAIERRMTSDPVFPPWYRAVFASRWRFSNCRLAVTAQPVNRAVLMQMGARTEFERFLFDRVLRNAGGRAASAIILMWLWLRLRPFSVAGLTMTALARKAAIGR